MHSFSIKTLIVCTYVRILRKQPLHRISSFLFERITVKMRRGLDIQETLILVLRIYLFEVSILSKKTLEYLE